MIDNRLKTFLKLCETMNYTLTAKALNMTQPAVTQQIHFLEREYNCKLFLYDGRKLEKTKQAIKLENYSRGLLYNEKEFLTLLNKKPLKFLRIGATKTIGNFVINDLIQKYISQKDNVLDLTIDNTQNLLEKVSNGTVDFAIVEGFFDRSYYGHKLFKKEKFTGICAKGHPFAGKSIEISKLFNQTLVLRESGSGTREIFEHILYANNFTLKSFEKVHTINSFQIIQRLVAKNAGISFSYISVADSCDDITTFSIKNSDITGEFNYVYLKNSVALQKISNFEDI